MTEAQVPTADGATVGRRRQWKLTLASARDEATKRCGKVDGVTDPFGFWVFCAEKHEAGAHGSLKLMGNGRAVNRDLKRVAIDFGRLGAFVVDDLEAPIFELDEPIERSPDEGTTRRRQDKRPLALEPYGALLNGACVRRGCKAHGAGHRTFAFTLVERWSEAKGSACESHARSVL